MKISIEIETDDKSLLCDLFGVEELKQGASTKLESGPTLVWEETVSRKDAGLPDIICLSLLGWRDIAVGMLSTWLYDKLKGRSTKLKIDNKETPIEKKAIQQELDDLII